MLFEVMRDMGFRYDPSTAGSSVRFDPPNPKDRVSCTNSPRNRTANMERLSVYHHS